MNNSYHKGRLCVKAKALLDGENYTFTVQGKTARTLLALIKASNRGITALELSNTWAVRLSAYIFNLRRNNGLDIETLEEPHPDGWHGRYVLKTPVKTLKVFVKNKK